MRRSLSLALYLLSAPRRGAAASPAQAPRPERPDGSFVWFHAAGTETPGALAQICKALLRDRPKQRIVATSARTVPDELPVGVFTDQPPADSPSDLAGFLGHWRPDLAVLVGDALPPALILACETRGIRVILAGLGVAAEAGFLSGFFRRSIARALLHRFDRILVPDDAVAERLNAITGGSPAVTVTGDLGEIAEPLGCTEAERSSLAQLLGTRSVWLAADCSPSEEDAVLAAHSQALRLAHRMLLILVPEDIAQGPAVADRITRDGFSVALRSQDEEPDAETQVLVADTDGEYGLWYRLAPVTYMGGTLVETGTGRNPMEPAALGSAIVCGPKTGRYAAAYARLSSSRALRIVRSASALAEAVGELIAPDRAALLAHNAWDVSSGGADVIDILVTAISETLDAPRPTRAAVRAT